MKPPLVYYGNRQKPGSPQFVPPGRCLVLLADDRSALPAAMPDSEPVPCSQAGLWGDAA
jgi:hypothetical protein